MFKYVITIHIKMGVAVDRVVVKSNNADLYSCTVHRGNKDRHGGN